MTMACKIITLYDCWYSIFRWSLSLPTGMLPLNSLFPSIYDIETVVLLLLFILFFPDGFVLPCDHGLDLWDQLMWESNQSIKILRLANGRRKVGCRCLGGEPVLNCVSNQSQEVKQETCQTVIMSKRGLWCTDNSVSWKPWLFLWN